MRRFCATLSKACASVVLGISVASCGGGGGGSLLEEVGSAILTFLSDGQFSDIDSLVTALDGDELKVNDFGTSVLGTNPGIFPRGSALVDDISCTADSCTGQVIVPTVVNGTLQTIRRETGTIRRDGEDGFVISSPTNGEHKFKKYVPPQPVPPPTVPGTGGTGSANLDKTASCERWWEAVGNKTWTFVRVKEDTFEPDVAGATLTFTGQYQDVPTLRSWKINGGSPNFMAIRSGTQVNLDDNWGTQKLCRFYLIYPNAAGAGTVIWAHSLSGGQLRFVLNPDQANPTNEWLLKAN